MKPEGLTSEWCTRMAASYESLKRTSATELKLAAALRIAAAVVDEGAVEKVSRVIAEQLYDDFDNAFDGRAEWVAASGKKGGRFRDINEPMQDDYRSAAQAVINHLTGVAGDES